MTAKPTKTTTYAAPALVNLWVNHAGYWLLEHQAVTPSQAHAAYRSKVERGTDPRDMRILPASV